MSLFDKDLALSQAGGSADLAKELFGMLIKDLPDSEQKMLDAHAQHNQQALWDAVHKVHGGTAYCGVPDLKSACKELEDEIKSQYPSDKIGPALDKVCQQIKSLITQADQFLADL